MHLTETVIFLKNEANKKLWLCTSSIICYFNDSSSNFYTAYFLTLFSFFSHLFLLCFLWSLCLSFSPVCNYLLIFAHLFIFSLLLQHAHFKREGNSLCFPCYVSVLRTVSGAQEVLNQYLSIDEQTHDGVLLTCHSSMCNAFQVL